MAAEGTPEVSHSQFAELDSQFTGELSSLLLQPFNSA